MKKAMLYKKIFDKYLKLEDALAAVDAGKNPAALIYTPESCYFAKISGKGIIPMAETEKISLENIFEIRCFCENYELRWVRKGANETGTASILSESSQKQKAGDFSQLLNTFSRKESADISPESSTECFSLSGQYLLWGEVTGCEKDVAALFEHRVGKIAIPDDGNKFEKGEHAILTYREYFKPDDYGNLTFFAERLTGIKK
jgi:CRISPR-associated protein (TIGR03984 family)